MNPLNVGFLKVKSRNYSDRSIKNCGRVKKEYQSTSKRYKVFGLNLANTHYLTYLEPFLASRFLCAFALADKINKFDL